MKPFRAVAFSVALAAIAVLTGSGYNSASAASAAIVYPVVTLGSGVQCILGGSAGGKWVKAADMQSGVRAGTKYRLYSLSGYVGASTGAKPTSIGAPCESTFSVEMSPQRTSRVDVFAVGGTWAAMPRLPRFESANQPGYIKAVGDVLRQKGIANPNVKIQQVIRVDLDGDGAPEVLISATNYAGVGYGNVVSPNSKAGDYSLVMARKLVKGQIQTSIVAGEFYPKAATFNAPAAFQIAGVLDLNGDKAMEVVLHGQYYEGEWHSAFQLDGAQWREVLMCGCGV